MPWHASTSYGINSDETVHCREYCIYRQFFKVINFYFNERYPMRLFKIMFLLFIVLAIAAPSRASKTVDPADGLVMSNEHVRLEFEPEGMGLTAMVDLATGHNHIQSVEGKHLLWEIAFCKGTQNRKINNNYKPCNYARVENLPDGGQLATLEWNELRWWLEDSVVTIR